MINIMLKKLRKIKHNLYDKKLALETLVVLEKINIASKNCTKVISV